MAILKPIRLRDQPIVCVVHFIHHTQGDNSELAAIELIKAGTILDIQNEVCIT